MPEQSDQNQGQLRALWPKDQVDTDAFFRNQERVEQLLDDLHQISPLERIEKLKNLFVQMEIKMNKLVDGDQKKISEITYHTSNGDFSFYDAESAILLAGDIEIARDVCKIGFSCYDLIIKKYGGVGITQIRANPKKKLLGRLYALALPDEGLDYFYENLYAEFVKKPLKPNLLNWAAYLEYLAPSYDMQIVNVTIGWPRSSKSTEFLHRARAWAVYHYNLENKLMADAKLVRDAYCQKRMIYSQAQKFMDFLSEATNDKLCVDDAFILGDKRKGMKSEHVEIGELINTCADGNNVLDLLIQQKMGLDNRIFDSAAVIRVTLRRGEMVVLAGATGYGLIPQYLGLEQFIKHPERLRDYDNAKHYLQTLPSYVGIEKYPPLGDAKAYKKSLKETGKGDSGNIFFDDYLRNKASWKKDYKDQKIKDMVKRQEEKRIAQRISKNITEQVQNALENPF